MYQEILRSVSGIGVFPAISLVLFFAVFTTVLVRVFRMDPAHAARLADIPFNSAEPDAAPAGARS